MRCFPPEVLCSDLRSVREALSRILRGSLLARFFLLPESLPPVDGAFVGIFPQWNDLFFFGVGFPLGVWLVLLFWGYLSWFATLIFAVVEGNFAVIAFRGRLALGWRCCERLSALGALSSPLV